MRVVASNIDRGVGRFGVSQWGESLAVPCTRSRVILHATRDGFERVMPLTRGVMFFFSRASCFRVGDALRCQRCFARSAAREFCARDVFVARVWRFSGGACDVFTRPMMFFRSWGHVLRRA